jgi:hypothetical protein
LLFTASKDHVINAWFSSNGERLGTYNGHNGTIWTIACDCECLGWAAQIEGLHALQNGIFIGMTTDLLPSMQPKRNFWYRDPLTTK